MGWGGGGGGGVYSYSTRYVTVRFQYMCNINAFCLVKEEERRGGAEEEEEEEEGLLKANAVNEEDPERDRATGGREDGGRRVYSYSLR